MIEKQKAGYGSWKSPITTDLMLADGVGFGEITCFNGNIYWIEMRPQEQGRYVIVKQSAEGEREDVIHSPFNARTRVHEYGGGSYLVTGKGVVFTNFKDQALYIIESGREPRRLTNKPECRYADFIYDKKRDRLISVREDHADKGSEPSNTIVSIPLSRPEDEKILVGGADFYSNPRMSPHGDQFCWISWLHPNMPWDNTCLTIADVNESGELVNEQVISGDHEAVCQPGWSENNVLYYVSDRSNWWNLYSFEHGQIRAVLEKEAEFAVPQWSLRENNYDFIDAQRIIGIYREAGIAYLGIIDISTNQMQTLGFPYTDYESIVCNQQKVWCLAGSPQRFPSILEYELESKRVNILRESNSVALDAGYISAGESLSFPVDQNNLAHAFYYAPVNRDYTGLDGELPPLLVMSHGGPTGESHNGLKMVVQFFTSRGFAVIDVNYGGSSGYGRAYRQRLNSKWGIVDVNDCSKAALHVADKGWVDRDRLAIRGGSAGGFTTLAALVFTDVFKAGASHYGVSDLESLAKETHKFESRYLDNLIGPYPDAKEAYIARSPINAVAGLSCPVIFFQGLEDKIVLPNQAERMVDALKKKGIPVAYIAYEGEQHGFRQARNIKRTLEAELYFYSTVFKFECAEDIEPVKFL